ncbi:response regulator [Geomonas sp. Red276]
MADKKLLLVDDAPENLQLLYQTLKGEYEIFSATSGSEALRLTGTLLPDLILLDIMMPEMDGYQVCEALKRDDRLREIPVIFLTALHEEADEVKGFEMGAVDFIVKPFKAVVVRRRVATHLELQQKRNQLEAANRELKEALDRIKVLSGLLPICMNCKKIRSDDGSWTQLETYISQHSEALFSHGYCPECGARMKEELASSLAARSGRQ